MPRPPDFLIIGTMKSGTTSLFRWLEQQPDFDMPGDKEPNFFCDDDVWGRGLEWYGSLFLHAADDHLTGEASVAYTDPRLADQAAQRIAATLPAVPLVCVLRNPFERLRSHYRHEVQRGRERRPFESAVGPSTPYVRRSMYHTCLEPYLRRFPTSQLLIVRFEDLMAPDHRGWDDLLRHIGAPLRPAPGEAHNVTADKPQYRRLMLRLWESGRLERLRRVPAPLRRAGKHLLTRRGGGYTRRLREADGPLPAAAARGVRDDVPQPGQTTSRMPSDTLS